MKGSNKTLFIAIFLLLSIVNSGTVNASPNNFTITVMGTVDYTDKNSTLHKLLYARVEIWDQNIGGTPILLGYTHTDTNGNFQYDVTSSAPNGPDIVVKFFHAMITVFGWVAQL
jgi:hypothetical protein